MISWQKILREETFSPDFELISDNDKFIIDGVRSSYKANLTASYEQVKEICGAPLHTKTILLFIIQLVRTAKRWEDSKYGIMDLISITIGC